jgi:hypothetical protein
LFSVRLAVINRRFEQSERRLIFARSQTNFSNRFPLEWPPEN